MKRKRRTPQQRLALLDANGRTCNLCGGKIDPAIDEWHLDHVIELKISGDDSDENLKPVHGKCHRQKQSATVIAKVKRVEAKHNGAIQKGTKWRKLPKEKQAGKTGLPPRALFR